MIKTVEIKNFRGFVNTKIKDFRRINFLVGDNGAGKTAFLEALFAAAARSVHQILRIREMRGLPPSGEGTSEANLWENTWRDLFYEFDTNKIVSISVTGTDDHSRALRIFKKETPESLPLDNGSKIIQKKSPISFEWTLPSGERVMVTPEVNDKGEIQIPSTPHTNISGVLLRPETILKFDPELYSNLSVSGNDDEFLKALQAQFKDVISLSVEKQFGATLLYVKKKNSKRRFPINLLSDGMIKITSILLNISNKPKGIVFIDEVDNGIYFKRHELLIKQMLDFSETFDAQVFATVHSLEFLMSLIPVMKKNAEEFSLVRIFQERGVSDATIASGEKAKKLIESGLEFRT